MAKECEVMSKTYKEIRVLPAALRASGAMEAHGTYSETLGFYITDSLRTAAGVHIPNKEATLIINGEIVTVTKKSGEVWVAGDAIFWLSGTTEFTNVNDGSGLLVGKAKIAAATGDATGDIVFKDYYPVQRGMQIGSAQIPYKMVTAFPGPIISVYATTDLITGSIDAAKINLVCTGEAISNYVKALRVTLESDVKMGVSARAIYGKVDLKTNGAFHGKGSVIGGELVPPASSMVRGTMSVFEGTVNVPSGGSWGSAGPCSFIDLFYTGLGKAFFTANGYLLNINGEAAGTGRQYFADDSIAAVAGGFRCLLNGVVVWLCYADN